MNDLRLNNLLHQADEAAPLPAVTCELATRVRSAERRRKNVRRVAGGIAILAITAAGFFWVGHFQPRHQQIVRTKPSMDLQKIRVELAQYQEQANQHMFVAEQLLKDERSAHQRRRIERLASTPDAQIIVETQRDQAAQILMDRADRLLQRKGDIEQAEAALQRVIELFPATPAARRAQDRLDNLKA